MSELDRVKKLAASAGIDADALFTDLRDVLLADTKEMLSNAMTESQAQFGVMQANSIKEIAGLVDVKLGQFRDAVQEDIGAKLEGQVRDTMAPLLEDAKKLNEVRVKLEEAARAGGGNSSSPNSSNSNGVTQQALLTEGLGIVKALIEQGNPVAQLTKMAELRNAFSAFEGQGPTPDTQARLSGSAFLEGLKLGGKAKASPLEEKPNAGSAAPSRGASRPSPSAPAPSRSLRDVVREIG